MKEMIKLNKISKKFGRKVIFDDVSLSIYDDSIYGLIGANGTGKTTLFNLLLNFKQVNSGEIIYNIDNVFYLDDKYTLPSDNIKSCISYMRTYDKDFDEEQLNKYIEQFEIPEKLKNASKGQRALMALFLALTSTASLILIDEIFDGLDQLKRNQIVDLIKGNKGEDRSFILIDHNFDRLEELCESYILIKDKKIETFGKIKFDKNNLEKYLG